MLLQGIHSLKDDDWYIMDYEVHDATTGEIITMGRASWADWDKKTHLVFAKRGRLFRQDLRSKAQSEPVQIADFNGEKPEAIAPPPAATRW